MNTLIVTKIQDGGYMIRAMTGNGYFDPPLFACTTLAEALAYIKRNLEK